MNRQVLKQVGIYAAIVLFFLVLSYAFVPDVLSGKIVNQSDISGWKGMAQETIEWNAAHPDDKALWSDSMFGGMPTATTVDSFDGDWTRPLYNALLFGTRPASYIFIALLGAFLMMLAMGVRRFLAVAGAIAVAFCAYNFQIIQVGHNTKMQAIAFAPWAIAALIFTYRSALKDGLANWKQWLPATVLGAVFFGLALSFQIKANHIQITYYLAIIIFIYVLATLIWVLQKGNRSKFGRFAAASAFLLVIGVVGIGTNANKLLPTRAYAPYTMRGGSELSSEGANDKGLALDYATAWSYGGEELPNMMIANFNGGSSNGSLGDKSATWQLFKSAGQNPREVCQNLPLYWGPQPFTAGPMYMGAISIFLFILGLYVLRGREKWWLLACSVLAILLALGNHLMWFTELWFEYAPLYNKFRTVSMALVILQFCVPLLGIYALDRIARQDIPGKEVVRGCWISLAVTAGLCLIMALIPSLAGNFVASSDSQIQDVVAEALREDRRHLLQADAWRSFLFIVVSAAVIVWAYLKNNITAGKRMGTASIIIAVLILVDMWSIGKRYLNTSHFVFPRNFNSQFEARKVDKVILEDKDPSYRVLDLSVNTFNSSVTSFRHKSIGGYSPTKMQRYQDLIDHHLQGEISSFAKAVSSAETLQDIQDAVPYMPVLSMLNGRYIIVSGDYPPVVNPYAFGPAWFVDDYKTVSSADAEIAQLSEVDLHKTAVIREGDIEGGRCVDKNPQGHITMESYTPNEVRYSYSCASPTLAVFSEIFHPSWTATVNGEPLPLFRADWVLRAAVLPEGCGEIVMRYEPKEYAVGRTLSSVCSILLLLLTISTILCIFAPQWQKETK